MIKTIAIVVVVLLVVPLAILLGFAATKPDTFRIQRATSIKAPPEKIFALISDFRSWGAWSPYEKLDPAMKRSYGGPASGKGAQYGWEGSGKARARRMESTQSSPPSTCPLHLAFATPFEG